MDSAFGSICLNAARIIGLDATVSGHASGVRHELANDESIGRILQIAGNATQGRQGQRGQVRVQQMRQILQSHNIVESSQTLGMRRHALRDMPDLRSKIQAQVRSEFSHRRLSEETSRFHGKEEERLKLGKKIRYSMLFFLLLHVAFIDRYDDQLCVSV